MRQRFLNIALVALVAAIATGCTHNNGDIGRWFGLWRVVSITVNGSNNGNYTGNIFFAFQSTTFEQKKVNDDHGVAQMIGEWREDGDALIITFPYDRYYPIDGYMIGGGEENRLTVSGGSDNKHLQLSLITPAGSTVVYSLEKY